MDLLKRLVGCFTAVLLACGVVVAESTPFTEGEVAAVDRFLQEQFSTANYGVVIGLVDESGRRVLGAGGLDNGTDKRVDGDTLFEIGSITKTFTSLLLLEMAQRGEVNLDDPVDSLLPPGVQAPARDGKRITLLNLAAQESGLPFNADNHAEGEWWEGFNAYSADDLYAFLQGHELAAVPGEAFQYSNVGFSLLGHALERRGNTDFESLVVGRICDPLRMNDTRIRLSPDQKSRLAVGHGSGGERTPYYDFRVMQPAGSLYSTPNDMNKYLSAQLGLTVSDLTPMMKESQVIRRREQPGTESTAIPWYDNGVYQPNGSRFYGHGGATIGFTSFIGFDTQRRRGVIVLTSQRIVQNGRRMWLPAGIGWAVLQGVPLTEQTGANLVYEVVGIGAALSTDEGTGLPLIGRVFPESPAGRAGLSTGQVIRKINGVSVAGKSLTECLELLGGPVGKRLLLEVGHPERGAPRTVELTREKFLTVG